MVKGIRVVLNVLYLLGIINLIYIMVIVLDRLLNLMLIRDWFRSLNNNFNCGFIENKM